MQKPTKRQLEFMDWEVGIFFHFGIRTYYEGHKDWDLVPMDTKAFNPTKLDCRQWIRAAKSAGTKYAVFTAKHHDGFANWNSAYTDYSVANAPWKDGKGDVVREFTDACREEGVKVGIYYSPAEFGSRGRDDYDDYFINQISELLTNYGKIDYLWFDGCGSENHEYDKPRIISAIRKMQPEILIFNMWDPDTRWVGNEDGYAPETNFNEVDKVDFSVMTDNKDKLEVRKFLPAECDCRIREEWFYSDADKVNLKSLDKLVDMYECSVGHGANFLLNVGPDRNGLIQESDVQRLKEFGDKINELYDGGIEFESDEITFDEPMSVDGITVFENIENGQFTQKFKITALCGDNEKTVFEGTTVGHKRICRFEPVLADGFKISVDSCKIKKVIIKKENDK